MAEAFVSRTMFIAGLIIAVLVASGLSAFISSQFFHGPPGPMGALGPRGLEGDTGATGPQGPAGILNPDYDSGWVATEGRIVNQFNHSLGTSDVFVYLLCKWYRNWTGSGGPMVHQFYYGGDWYGDPQQMQGFNWDCYTENPNMIEVSQYGGRADELRVLIWKLPEQ